MHDMVGNAIEMKQRAMAQSDAKAMAAYVANQKLQEYQRQAPLREQMLRERLAHEQAATAAIGSHERFLTAKDTEAMQDVAALSQDAMQMKTQAGDPAHMQELTSLMLNHPAAMTTKAGQEAIKQLSQAHNDVLSMTPPDGSVLSHIEVGSDGKQKAVFKPAPIAKDDPAVALGAALAASTPSYGRYDGKTFTPTQAGTGDQTHVQTTYIDPKTRALQINKVLPRAFFDNLVAGAQAPQPQVAPVSQDGVTPQSEMAMSQTATMNATAQPDTPAVTPDVAAPAAAPMPDIHQQAFQALQSGAPREAVFQRLQQLGGFPAKVLQLESEQQAQQQASQASATP